MTQKHGRNYENGLVSTINEKTDDNVVAISVGYSGNDKHSFADIAVLTPNGSHFIEAKKRNAEEGKRRTVLSGGHEGESGFEELERLANSTPSYAYSWVALKWDHRAVHVIDADQLRQYASDEAYTSTYLDSARLTGSDSISIRKPTTDEHPSARSNSDWDLIRHALHLGDWEV